MKSENEDFLIMVVDSNKNVLSKTKNLQLIKVEGFTCTNYMLELAILKIYQRTALNLFLYTFK